MSGPFDFIKSINEGKRMRVDGDYSQYLTNMNFSLFPDTIFTVNEMNTREVSDQQHYDYMMANVAVRKRYAKWPKKMKKNDDVALIMQKYKYNIQRAKEVVSILTDEQMDIIRKEMMGV